MSTLATPPAIDPAQHLGLVFKIAHEIARRDHRLDADELAGVGYVGLTKAALKHDPLRGNFAALAWHYVAGEIRGHLKRERRAMQPLPEGVDGHTLEPAARPEPEPGGAEDVEHLLRVLPRRDRVAVEMFYGLLDGTEMSVEEVALALGTSVRRARQVLNRAMLKLKKRAGLAEAEPAARSRAPVAFPHQ